MQKEYIQIFNHVIQLQKKLPNQLIQFYEKLFQNTQNGLNYKLHKNKRIIVSGKNNLNQLFNGVFMKKLKQQNIKQYQEIKNIIIQLLIKLCHVFKLNSKFIQQTYVQSKQKKTKIPFTSFLLQQIYQTFQQIQQQTFKIIKQRYSQNLITLFYLITQSNAISISHLQKITQKLCDHYYTNTLTLKSIQTSFRLIQAGIQERSIQPFLYFIQNSQINAIKVMYNNPKWIFNKGMTIWLWFDILALLDDESKNECVLFLIKTQLNSKIVIRLLKNMNIQIVSYVNNKESQSVIITCEQHRIKMNQITTMGIQFQVIQGGFLKSSTYLLNLNINGKYLKKSILNPQKTPKFSANQMITDFILFDSFIGTVYSIIISNKNQLNAYQKLTSTYSYYGICNESQVWNLVQSNILKKQNIVAIFNAERSFEGILINYVGQKNLACFSGLVSKEKYNKYDYQIIDVLSPYLYFLIISKKQQQSQKFNALFDMILKHIINIISLQNQNQIVSEDILFILYFLQLSQYSITQSTLNYLIQQTKINKGSFNNVYFQIIGKYIDASKLLQKGLTIYEEFQIQFQMNPVRKIQLMFYLETKWKEKWNQFQGFTSWWSPSFFKYQNDQEFDSKLYSFDQNKQNKIQWQVRNFISNDLCKAIIMPIFKIPQYADLNKFQQQYTNKECMQQDFTLQLGSVKKGNIFMLKKNTISSFDKVKMRFLNSSKQTVKSQNLQKTKLLKKTLLKYEITSECLYIDLLTVIISTAKITSNGFIIISSKHTDKRFDHLCVKAFKNQSFKYITFHLSEINYIRKRRFNQSNNTLQIRRKNGEIYLLYLYQKNIDNFISILSEHVNVKKDPYSSYLDSQQPFKWIEKAMSNFQYIQWLNDVAGRNFLDITQYPVLPWVFVANHQKQINQQKSFRNLLKNMGSLGTQDRIKHFLEKYSSNNQQQLFSEYHFGTHYSSSAIIFNYLIRVRPFSVGAYTLQSGKFDCADRVFWSYIGSWINSTCSPTDIRQLIPQIYTLPEMFLNINNYDFGLTQQKFRIDNVQIPKWADKNPYKFITTIRKKLQSNYCSQNISHWIDLIFGYKQRGKQAIDNMNIFFPLTYQDAINLDNIEDQEQKLSFETQIAHFGQNPSQIIGSNPHPLRMKQSPIWQGKLVSDGGQNILIQKCNLDKTKSAQKAQKFLYKSIFQPKNAIMSIKFLDQIHFIVIRKHQYTIFKILHKKADFISKQQQIAYQLQTTQISIDYKQLHKHVPSTTIGNKLMAVGGFYNSYIHFLFVDQPKCNQALKFNMNTITSIQYTNLYKMLYLADNQGYLKVLQVNYGSSTAQTSKEIQFLQINSIKLHDKKINYLTLNQKANLAATCSQDGYVKLLNLYSQQLIRVYRNPDFVFSNLDNNISFCQISISPLYSITFFSQKSKKIYSYSINGQYLSSHTLKCQKQNDKQNFIYNMQIVPSSDGTQRLIFTNSNKQIYILQMSFLQLKRKIKLKKDDKKITCFQCCSNGKICLIGSQDSTLNIIGDPNCY